MSLPAAAKTAARRQAEEITDDTLRQLQQWKYAEMPVTASGSTFNYVNAPTGAMNYTSASLGL